MARPISRERVAAMWAEFEMEYECGHDVFDYFEPYEDDLDVDWDDPDLYDMTYQAAQIELGRDPYAMRRGLLERLSYDDGSDPVYTGMLKNLIVSMDLYLAQYGR